MAYSGRVFSLQEGKDDVFSKSLQNLGVKIERDSSSGNVKILDYDSNVVSEKSIIAALRSTSFAPPAIISNTENKAVFQTDGMTCGGCASTIKRLLEEHGIVNSSIDFATNKITINPYNTEIISQNMLEHVIKAVGAHEKLPLKSTEISSFELPTDIPESTKITPEKHSQNAAQEPTFDASSAALSCCIASMAGDLAKVAEVSNSTAGKYSGNMDSPDTKSRLGIGVTTAILGFSGACASLETFSSAKEHVNRLKEALGHIKTIRTFVAESPQQDANDLEGVEAIELFLKRQLRKAQFVKWTPGATSAAASGTLGLGGLIWVWPISVDENGSIFRLNRARQALG